MSLIEAEKANRSLLAGKFFLDVLVPLGETLRAEGKSFFSLSTDVEAESYYADLNHRVMAPADFELKAADSIDDFVKELAKHWRDEGYASLAEIAPKLYALAQELAYQEEQEKDVSAFRYVMF